MQEWHLLATGAGIVVSVVGITKVMLAGAVKEIKDHCVERLSFCDQRMSSIECSARDAEEALHKHGHKALDLNGSKVTR